MDWENKVVLIAGATGNLGVAVARRFGSLGARLALVDRSQGRLERTYPEHAGSQTHRLIECVNMADAAQVSHAVQQALELTGGVDVFVSVVGGYRAGSPLHETPVETLDFLFELNVRTFYLAARAVVPGMIERGRGKIIAVGARPGLKGVKNMAAYSAAKSALMRLVESMAGELRTRGVNVNGVLPGTMDTAQNRAASPDADTSRWVGLDSVAGVIAFLCSEDARDIHGAMVPVYGLS